mgnify:CR=1 FL=1|tara:strand:+ start:619 stop:984 length:366 start_codon:yes stop_codon:yes gene_type:complete
MDDDGHDDPRRAQRDERSVRSGFWRKVKRTLGTVPFLDEAMAAYFCAVDSQTPGYVQALLFGALAYFVVPTDMIPDFIAGLGYSDDATVLLTAISTVRRHITGEHRDAARQKLADLRDADD